MRNPTLFPTVKVLFCVGMLLGSMCGTLRAELVGSWPLADSGTSQTIVDASSYATPMVRGSTAGVDVWDPASSSDAPSGQGGSLVFDGTNDFCWASLPTHLKPTSEFTVTCWVKLAPGFLDSFTYRNFVSTLARHPTGGGYQIFTSPGLNPVLAFEFRSTELIPYTAVEVPLSALGSATASWMHVAGVYKTQGTGAACTLYVNGELRASGTFRAPISYANCNRIFLGTNIDGDGGNWFDQREHKGALSGVRIYNHALGAADIAALAAGSSGPGPTLPPPSLLAHWKFDGYRSAQMLGDSSGNRLAIRRGTSAEKDSSDPVAEPELTVPKESVLRFDGLDDGLIRTNTTKLLVKSFTFMARIKVPNIDFGFQDVLFSTLGHLGGGAQFALSSPNGTRYWDFGIRGENIYSNDYGMSVPFSQAPIEPGRWYHVAAVCQELPGTRSMLRMYIDGNEIGSREVAATISYVNTPWFYVGTNYDGDLQRNVGDREFEGLMDDVRFYQGAASQSFIREAMHQ